MNQKQKNRVEKNVNLELPEHSNNPENLAVNDFGLLYALFIRFDVDISMYIMPKEKAGDGTTLDYTQHEDIGLLEKGLQVKASFDQQGRAEYIKIVRPLEEKYQEKDEKEPTETTEQE